MVRSDATADRTAAALLLRHALAYGVLGPEMERPDRSRDKSTRVALRALDDYLEDLPCDDDATREWWQQELGAMADLLSCGEPLSGEQLLRWREFGGSRSAMVLVLFAMLGVIGWGIWDILT